MSLMGLWDGNACLFCGYFDSSNREVANLFVVEHGNELDDVSLNKKLRDLHIGTIEPTQCELCHQHFGQPHYSIGIGLDHKLIVSDRIRDEVT